MQPTLTPLEVACGLQFGRDNSIAQELRRRQESATSRSASEVLIDVVESAVAETTYVMFSGGVDSSLVLAAAVTACRRAGVAPPVPVTYRYPEHPDSFESEYQEAVIGHLGLDDWLIFEIDEELDVLGEPTRAALRQWGLCAFARTPSRHWLLEQLTAPAVLLTGEGGDGVFAPAPLAPLHYATAALRAGRARRHAARWLAQWPREHAAKWRRSRRPELPWLTPGARRQAAAAWRELYTGDGWTMKSYHRSHRSKRYINTLDAQLSEIGEMHGIRYVAPLLDLDFIANLTALVPDREFMDRTYVVQRYFPGMLPDLVATRLTKASFRSSVMGRPGREFAERWDGTGVPLDLVDPEVLREVWLEGSDARSTLLMQHAWLATEGAA